MPCIKRINVKLLSLLFVSLITIDCTINGFMQNQKVYIYENNSKYSEIIKKAFNKFNIMYELTNSISTDNDNLYIIFDLNTLDKKQLPKYYIAYQTQDLSQNPLTQSYINKLSSSIAVWDYNRNNINYYNSILHNYYYMPDDYEFTDPVILPCFLASQAFEMYKETLIYSNRNNTDISSHLPALFCYSYLQHPNFILEIGVRGGESTFAFHKTLNLCKTKLLGIDIDSVSSQVYSTINNAQFFCINDLDFPAYIQNTNYKVKKMDVIFIDTSHLYEHTLQEIKIFVPLLNYDGMLLFHDSNVTPINGHQYYRINGSIGGGGFDNTRGVTRAIKEYFSLVFNEHEYCNNTFIKDGETWQIIHYPFCNGLTIIKKINR